MEFWTEVKPMQNYTAEREQSIQGAIFNIDSGERYEST